MNSIECPCGFAKNVPPDQNLCRVCNSNLSLLHKWDRFPIEIYDEGKRFEKNNQSDLAIEHYIISGAFAGNWALPYLRICEIHLKKNRLKSAQMYFKRAKVFSEDSPELHKKLESLELKIKKSIK